MAINPWIPVVATLVGSSVMTFILTKALSKEDYELSATSCSETGPEKAFIQHEQTGYRVQIPDADIPASLDRVTKLTNTGSKMLDGERVDITIDNNRKAKIFEHLVFFESPLSRHTLKVVDLDDGSKIFSITLKQFNPNDTIAILTNSNKQVDVTAISKGNGYTFSQHFGRSSYCKLIPKSGYGGFIAYRNIAEGCNSNPNSLDLSCTKEMSYKTPKDFPPGKAKIIFE